MSTRNVKQTQSAKDKKRASRLVNKPLTCGELVEYAEFEPVNRKQRRQQAASMRKKGHVHKIDKSK